MAGGGEIQFPEPIIQRLQSFLNGKEAARTTIVSKSWHSAWLTRPNLDFDDTHFRECNEFSKHAKKTIKRYKKSNLKIESFKLCMEMDCYGRAVIANKLIVKALRIGATHLSTHLSFRQNNNRRDRSYSFVLPHEVFGADNLVGLSVSGCRINLDDGVVIKCRRLESLMLDDEVDITANTLSNIISGCPSIQKLSLLSDIYFHHDNEIEISSSEDDNEISWEDQRWGGQEEDKEQRKGRREAAAAMAVGLVDNLLHRLRCLVVRYVSFKTLRLGDLLSRFPFLKDFTLYLKLSSIGNFKKEIQISNCTLEHIKLGLEDDDRCYYTFEERRPRVKFDVPSVRKFTFEGDIIPLLSFISTPSREWESHVSLNYQDRHSFTTTTFWFGELGEFLTKLSQSKTHLSLNVGNGNTTSFDYKPRDNIIQGLRKHELENLTIDMTDLPYLSCYALFDGLFRLCSPKLITPYYNRRRYLHPYSDRYIRNTNIDFLCQTLEQGVHVKVWSPTQFMYGLNDLEEVNAQALIVDDVPAEWRPIPLKSLIDADAPIEQQRVRLLLKWKPN